MDLPCARQAGYVRMQVEMRIQTQAEPVPGVGLTRRATRLIQILTLTGQMAPLPILRQTTIGTKLAPLQRSLLRLAGHPQAFLELEMTETQLSDSGVLDSVPGARSNFNLKTTPRDYIGILPQMIMIFHLCMI